MPGVGVHHRGHPVRLTLPLRAPPLGGRVLLVALIVVISLFTNHPLASAAISLTKSCTGPDGASTASVGDTATCTLTINTSTTTDILGGATITIAVVANNYTFSTAPTCTTSAGTCTPGPFTSSVLLLTCTGTTACSNVVVTETI